MADDGGMKTRLLELWHAKHHLYEAWLWVVLAAPTLLVWRDSVLWVALMSLYANYKTAIGAHEGRQARRNTENGGGQGGTDPDTTSESVTGS